MKLDIKENKTILSLKIRTFVSGIKGGKKKKVTMTILDSILLLKSSLRRLDEDFEASILKTEFPHKFLKIENLYYIDSTLFIYYFNDISDDNYNVLFRNDWSFKDESLKYLINDVESLREILFKFAGEILELFDINIIKYKTLPSLAFLIFLSNFYNKENNQIKIIKDDVKKNIKTAYYGEITQVFEYEIFYEKPSRISIF